MARPLRIAFPNAWYHVMNRGRNRSLIFRDPDDPCVFLSTLEEACNLFHVSLGAYCLMPNHYHALVHTPEANLSRFMRHLDGVYTQRHNRLHWQDGPLFRGRYKAILVQEDDYFLQVVKYIHLNPVKAKLAKDIGDHAWSSHRYFINSKGRPDWLEAETFLSYFSGQKARAVRRYQNFMMEDMNPEVEKFYFRKNQGAILGEDSFIEWIRGKYLESGKGSTWETRDHRTLRGNRALEVIIRTVCDHFKIAEEDLMQGERGRDNLPRRMAFALARELSGLTQKEIAQAFGAGSYRTVGTACFRFRKERKRDSRVARQYEKIRNRCG